MNLSTDFLDKESLVDHYSDPGDALKAERSLIEQFKNPAVQYHIAWWTTTQSLIAPRSMKRVNDIEDASKHSAYRGWPVYFRQTGGDVTPQGPGVLNLALAFALDPTERPSISAVYQMFCAPIVQWLIERDCDANTGYVPGSFCDGEYNVIAGTQKVAGTAQRWARIRADESRQIVFAHALFLLDADIEAGVSAINQLYENCGSSQSVVCPVHTNLKDVLSNNTSHWRDAFVVSLNETYTQELKALTS